MNIDYHDLYNEQGFDLVGAKYEISHLQLHNLECIQILKKKEKEYQDLKNESDELKYNFL